jgi:hypothetical protein
VSLVARPNAHGEPVLFGDNWPEGARHWLPSVDHPSDKATVDFAITADERFEAVAPGRLVEERELSGGRRLTRWSAPVAIPAYCMVVGLADFQVTRLGTADGIPLSLWVFAPDAGAATPMFARSVAMLEYFADLLGPYPYSKLAQVESTIRYSGMENASAIFYAEAELQGPNVDEFPVAHEIAHQWWGNSVTPADWDDLWLSEGFATYFDALFYEHIEGPEALRGRLRAGAERLVALDARRPGAIVDPEVTDPAATPPPRISSGSSRPGAAAPSRASSASGSGAPGCPSSGSPGPGTRPRERPWSTWSRSRREHPTTPPSTSPFPDPVVPRGGRWRWRRPTTPPASDCRRGPRSSRSTRKAGSCTGPRSSLRRQPPRPTGSG